MDLKNIASNLIAKYGIAFIIGIAMIFLLAFGVLTVGNKKAEGNHPRLNHVMKFVFVNPGDQVKNSKEEINDLKSLKNSLTVAGIRYTEAGEEDLKSLKLQDYDIIILPYAIAKYLTDGEINNIKEAVNKGSDILIDGISKLTDALSIVTQNKLITVSQVRDLQYPKDVLYWTDSVAVAPFDTSQKNYNILCTDESSQLPVAISGTFGKGKFISYSALFDPITDKGYTRFPFLIETLNKIFGTTILAERKAVEMYFDPGIRFNMKIEDLAKLWRKNGIKVIYAGGWYFDSGFDYKKLLNACHANGILVYCWLETPMISKGFWDKHPEWREKTAYLKDAYIDWRYLMNLADENCRKEIFRLFDQFLMNYEWDGVDLAELYFEPSPVGPELPENFTPMNNIVREEFKKAGGFDPVQLFDTNSPHYWKTNNADWKKFATYRKDLCFRLKTHFLDFLSILKNKKKNLEVMLTVIDVSLTPELSDNIAEDTQHTLSLYNKYGFDMQIEDPSNCWGFTPERYNKLGLLYRNYIKEKNKLIFDCNVVNSHEKGYGGFPAEKPTGEEIRQIVYNMSLSNSRPAFYSEDAINENDFTNINMVLARDAKIDVKSESEWEITTPYTITVHTGIKSITAKLDNKAWFARNGEAVIIPQGTHKFEFDTGKCLINTIGLKAISGELNRAEFRDSVLEFSYSEGINSCYVIVNSQPSTIFVDDRKTDCEIFKNDSLEYSVKLPKGNHVVRMNL